MSQYPDELGSWWTEFPGSDRAAWLAPSSPSAERSGPGAGRGSGALSRGGRSSAGW